MNVICCLLNVTCNYGLHLCAVELAILMFSLLNFGMDKYKVD